MAYVYIKSGGTADGTANGVHATQQTGSFAALGAANYYSDMAAAFAQGGADDLYCVSDANSLTASEGNVTITNGQTAYTMMYITCVSDTNIDQEVDDSTSTNAHIYFDDMNLNGGRTYFQGLYVRLSDDLTSGGNHSMVVMRNCRFNMSGPTSVPFYFWQALLFRFINCDIDFGSNAGQALFRPYGGTVIQVIGGSLSSTNDVDMFVTGSFDNGGGTFEAVGVDMSGFNTDYYLNTLGGVDDFTVNEIDFKMINCKLDSGHLGFVEDELALPVHRVDVIGCDNASAASQYQFYLERMSGKLQDETSIYLTATAAVFGATKVSAKLTTRSTCAIGTVFTVEIPWLVYADLTAAGSDSMRIHFATASGQTITPEEMYFDVFYPDDTNNEQVLFTTNRPANIWGSTTYTTDTGAWTGTVGTQYYVDLDLSAGEASAPRIVVTCTAASKTVYINPAPVFS